MGLGEQFDSTLDAARMGAEWAWTALFNEIAAPVTGYLRSQGAIEPEQVAGDVFFELARSIDRFSGDESSFRTFVFSIAYRRLIDERRANSRRPRTPMAEEILARLRADSDVEEQVVTVDSTNRIRELLGMTTAEQRDVLTLRIIAGLTIEETATVVGRNPGAVKQLQRRGLAKVRDALEQEGVTL